SFHYFMWVLPFFLFVRSESEPWPSFWSAVLVLLLALFTLDGRRLNLELFVPVDPVYFSSLPSLHEFMDRWLPWGKAVAAARLCFSALCLFLAWRLFDR